MEEIVESQETCLQPWDEPAFASEAGIRHPGWGCADLGKMWSVFFMALLQVQRVFAGYRPDTPIIRDISLELRPGDFVGLIGPNGSGKSTLLRLAAGVLPFSAGRVEIEGRDIHKLGRRSIARILGCQAHGRGSHDQQHQQSASSPRQVKTEKLHGVSLSMRREKQGFTNYQYATPLASNQPAEPRRTLKS